LMLYKSLTIFGAWGQMAMVITLGLLLFKKQQEQNNNKQRFIII